jgi:hypothetical protein
LAVLDDAQVCVAPTGRTPFMGNDSWRTPACGQRHCEAHSAFFGPQQASLSSTGIARRPLTPKRGSRPPTWRRR